MIRIKIRKEIDRKKYLLFAILSFVIVLAAWLIASESGAIKEIFLPKPQNVVNYYIESIKDGSLLQNTGISIYRITLGFVYAVLLGVPIGILVGTFKKAEAFIRPLCEFVRYMPVPAFVPSYHGMGRHRGKCKDHRHFYRYIFPACLNGCG